MSKTLLSFTGSIPCIKKQVGSDSLIKAIDDYCCVNACRRDLSSIY